MTRRASCDIYRGSGPFGATSTGRFGRNKYFENSWYTVIIIKISSFQFWLTKIRFLPYCRLFNPINFILTSSWWGDLPDTLPGQPGSDDPAADLSGAGTRRPPLRQPGEPLPQLSGLLWAQRAGPASTLRPAWPTIRHTSLWLGPESSLSSPWPAAAWSWWRRG